MGAWGPGNFDCDEALDVVGDLCDEVGKYMTVPEYVEDVDLRMACVSIRLALVKHCGAPLPDRASIETLGREVLRIYDAQIDGLKPDPEYKRHRRKVIEDTFFEFLQAIDARKRRDA